MKNYIYTFLFLLVSQIAISQTPVTIVKENTYTITAADGDTTLSATKSITLKPNTWIKSGSTFTAKITENISDTSLSNDQNYVFTRSFQSPMSTFNPNTAKAGDVIEQITYFDGLGRPMQNIALRSGGKKEGIITHIAYDALGRQNKDYLPYAELTNRGSFITGAKNETLKYYVNAARYKDDFPGMTIADINPYSQKDLEASPLNRVFRQAAPGKDWKLGNGNEIEFEYLGNQANEVKRFNVSLSFANNTYTPTLTGGTSYYAANKLYKTITYDENHDGTNSKDHTTEEFKDKQGRVVLKRTYNTYPNATNETTHDTYYVYDNYGNLSYVLPPKTDATTTNLTTLKNRLNDLGYQYKYDHKNRLVEKKIPGKGIATDWEEIVYNKLDQPILTRDPNLKAQGKWLFTKYDAFGRVAYTGLYSNGSSRTVLQGEADAASSHYVSNNPATTLAGTTIYYNNDAYPSVTATDELHTINYYDNYTFDIGAGVSETAYTITPITNAKGLSTGSKVRVLGSNPVKWITTVSYYDDKSRPIYMYSLNDYLGTTDKVKSKWDFVKVLETTSTHKKTGQDVITTVDTFTYDHVGRLISQKQKINTLEDELIVLNKYDDLGQLENKKTGGNVASAIKNSTGLQTVDYSYNVRGWLKGINNTNGNNSAITLGSRDLFGFQINYNTPSTGGTALYNGNISQTLWKSTSVNNTSNPIANKYSYSYDALNRITNAISNNTANYSLNLVDYDKNGNILHLKRNGHRDDNATVFGLMDDLTYSYDGGNKLLKVADAATIDQYGFKDDAVNTTPDTSNDYTYDANGNMLTDANKGISTNIAYNHLNLPTKVTFSNDKFIDYIYDALGTKLRKLVHEKRGKPKVVTIKTIDYAGNYMYENNKLNSFNHPEGYIEANYQIERDGSLSILLGFNYIYQYKDHLGNIRLSYKDANQNNSNPISLEILEENNYYPFGLKHKGYNNIVASTNPAQKYKYNGKELQDELGLDWYDLGARMFDPAIGRFMTIDPMADFINYQSPYVVADNNPIAFIDFYGLGKNRCGWLCRAFNRIVFGGDNLLPSGQLDRKISRGTGWVRNKPKPKKKKTNTSSDSNCTTCGSKTRVAMPDSNFGNTNIVSIPATDLPELRSPNPRKKLNDPVFGDIKIKSRLQITTYLNFINGGLGTNLDVENSRTNRTLNAIIKTLVDFPQLKLYMYINKQINKNHIGKNGVLDKSQTKRRNHFIQKRSESIIKFLESHGIKGDRIEWGYHPDAWSMPNQHYENHRFDIINDKK